jgi:AcrR family transcriptional regulator
MNTQRLTQGTRSLILQAAFEIVGVYGFAGVTLGHLARKVGMSKSGLFAHFKSIEQVHLALITYAVDVFRSDVILPALEADEGLPRLEATMSKWLEWTARPGTFGGSPLIAGFFEFDDREGAVRDSLLEQEVAWRDHLRQLVAATVATGAFRQDLNSEQFVSELCGIYYSFHVSARFLRSPESRTTALLAVDGLLNRAEFGTRH